MISFVIPAHNEEAALPRTLEAIHDAARVAGRPYEIVVANDASTDATAEVARQHGAIVADCNNRQIAATRNSGARASRGDILFFIDADTIVNPRAVAASLRALDKGAVGGGATVWLDGPVPLYIQLIAVFGGPMSVLAGVCGGAFLFSTRAAFDKTGGFNQRLYWGEEGVFIYALKRRGRFVVVWPRVLTSGRRFRAASGMRLLAILARMALSPVKAFTQRPAVKKLWYDSDRSGDDIMPNSVLDQVSNGLALAFMLFVATGPLHGLMPRSWVSMDTLFGKIWFGTGVFLCHGGLLFWPLCGLLLWSLLRRGHWMERLKTAAIFAFCFWQAWDSTEGCIWTWKYFFGY